MDLEALESLPVKKYDVIIVGAGPGGATCALRLAQSSLTVALIDKAVFPRDKICGDALSGKVISVLKYIHPEAVVALHTFPPKVGSWGIRFVAPNDQMLDIPFKLEGKQSGAFAPGYISRRVDFDHLLLQQAASYPNIDVLEGFGAKSVTVTSEEALVSDGTQTLSAPLVIGADGAHSIVTKQLSKIRMEPNHYCAGVRAYYQNVSDFQEDNFIELHFIKHLLPGYFWIFPLPNNCANVGLGMLSKDISKHKVNLKKRLLEVVDSHPTIAPRFKHAKLESKVKGFGLPLGSKKRRISGNRFMLIGDAASLIDPFSGEGIGNAMISGKIAAEHCISAFEAGDYSEEFLQAYDHAVYRKIWSELNLSRKMQKMVRYHRLFNFFVRKANGNEAIRTMLTMMFDNLDIRKELRNPAFYWKLARG